MAAPPPPLAQQRPTTASSLPPRPPSSAPTATAPASVQAHLSSALAANNVRLAAIVERLGISLACGRPLVPQADLGSTLFALARGIDYSLSGNDVPGIAHRLPSIIKQVFKYKVDSSMMTAVLVTMISAKNACKNGWFITRDSDELISMADELCSSFCASSNDVSSRKANDTSIDSDAVDTILKIIPRYYPQLKFCSLIVSFEAKPGYDVLMTDFQVHRNIPPDEKIKLLVVQKDTLESSSCIINPQQVSFLINGNPVEKRNTCLMDPGPQFPTDITRMLKYGTNMIQAIGYFSGNYIIAIVFMSKMNPPDASKLENYVHPIVEKPLSDSDVIEGPSRITLNCPISFKRILIPVKGFLCKHHQCFDYENFMQMNARKPSWRCPCCNSAVSCIDLRIDKKMVKILQEVEDGIDDIVISADGSWKTVLELNGRNQHDNRRSDEGHHDDMEIEMNSSADVVDLTMEEDCCIDTPLVPEDIQSLDVSTSRANNDNCELEDRKPLIENLTFPVMPHAAELALSSAPLNHQTSAYPAGVSLQTLTTTSVLGNLETLVSHVMLNPVQSEPISLLRIQDSVASHELSQPALHFQHVPQATRTAEDIQGQQLRVGGSVINSDTGRPMIPRHVNKNPVAIQALPVQTQISSRRIQTSSLPSNMILNSPTSASYQTPGLNVMSSQLSSVNHNAEMEQRSRPPDIVLPSLQVRSTTQSQGVLGNHNHAVNSSLQNIIGLSAANLISSQALPEQLGGAGAAYIASLRAQGDNQNSRQVLNLRHQSATSTPRPQIPSISVQQMTQNIRSSSTTSVRNSPVMMRASQLASQTAMMRAGVARYLSAHRPPHMPALAAPSGSLPSARLDGLPSEQTSEHNWQPTGRMRGSLTGNAYSAALNQYLAPQSSQSGHPQPTVAAVSGSDNIAAFSARNTFSANDHRLPSQRESRINIDPTNQSGSSRPSQV